eukprot:Rmarinus@m.4274
MSQCEYIFKYIVIGDMGVGKSCLLYRFTEQKFLADAPHTIGVEFGTRVVEVCGTPIKLQVWDTAGQERFRAVTRSYYRGSAGVLLAYDITNRKSFLSCQNWLTDARSLTNAMAVIILIGTKNDLATGVSREVSYEEAASFADEHGLIFLETSAKTGNNVEEVFLRTANQIYTKIQSGALDVSSPDSGVQVIRSSTVNLGAQPQESGACAWGCY